jgi:DNA-binding NarL/FixJ family response regulator
MRVVIVAPSAPAAVAIRQALRYAPVCRVIGWLDERRPCGDAVAETRPDVVVVDGGNGVGSAFLERAREAREALPTVKIVALIECIGPAQLAETQAAGVDAAILKGATPATVGMLVREVAQGHVFHFAPPGAAAPASRDLQGLTPREMEILLQVAAGLPNSRIAANLWVTEQTVKFHLSNLYRKLGLANRTEAANYAHTHGLVNAMGPARALPVAA